MNDIRISTWRYILFLHQLAMNPLNSLFMLIDQSCLIIFDWIYILPLVVNSFSIIWYYVLIGCFRAVNVYLGLWKCLVPFFVVELWKIVIYALAFHSWMKLLIACSKLKLLGTIHSNWGELPCISILKIEICLVYLRKIRLESTVIVN